MRKLSEQIGVQAPTTDYVKGRIVDNTTPVNEAINGDIIEFFHRMAWMASITENNLPDNVTNGHQLLQALQYLIELYSKVANNADIKSAVIPIGAWDMDASTIKTVSWTLPSSHYVVGFDVVIISDDGYNVYHLDGDNGWSRYQNNLSNFYLSRILSGIFDSTSYDDAVMNRGYITVRYKSV